MLFFSAKTALESPDYEAEQSFEVIVSKLRELTEKVANNELLVSEALLEIDENDVELLMKPSVVHADHQEVIAKGVVACTGAAHGVLCLDLADLPKLVEEGKQIIWVTNSIGNDDLCHLHHFSGIFAINEDPSSHAIIVTRVHNIPCITLPSDVIKTENELITPNGIFKHGDEATLDAFNGHLLLGKVPLHYPADKTLLDLITTWSERYAQLDVHGNADDAKEAKEALEFGAKGVDPRTEHMFFQPERLQLFRKAILTQGGSEETLNQLMELQRQDFVALFQAMRSYPVKIRLLDPPLHEFLPEQEEKQTSLAIDLDIPVDELKRKVEGLREANPMMGHRGVRLLLTFPSLLKMQVRAIFEASLDSSLKESSVTPHIVIPMIISAEEVRQVKKQVEEVYQDMVQEGTEPFNYKLGIMMETPRACLLSSEIAPFVDFISFGTNDLTGQTLALSRGDVYDKFLKYYLDNHLLEADPFAQIDPAVKELMRICIEQMRRENSHVIVGICGEHASQKKGIFICQQLGMDTVSCAAFRVPVVKLFAAQAAILHPR